MNEVETNDLDAMTGIGEGGAPALILDQLSLNGDAEIVEKDGVYSPKGGYYRLLKLSTSTRNEKPAEEKLGERVSVVFLKVRRALQQRSTDGKLRLWTSEHTSPDDIVELHSSESQKVLVGSARSLRERFEGLRTVQYVYGLLIQPNSEPRLIKMKFKGSALGSEVKDKNTDTFYDFIFADRKDEDGKKVHLRHYETVLSTQKEVGKKTYFTVVFTLGRKLNDEWRKLADDTLREVHAKITAQDEARARRIAALEKEGAGLKPVDKTEPAVEEDIQLAENADADINPDDIPF